MKKSLFAVSMLTLGVLYGLLAIVVIIVVKLAGGSGLAATIACIASILLQFLIGPWITDLSMRLFYRADFRTDLPEYLNEFTDEVCARHGMKRPKIGVINDGAPNAFTYGRTKNDARVIITRGLMELLDEEEVKAVVGHELGHASHYDMLFMTVAQVVPLIMYGIYEFCMRMSTDSGRSDSDDNKAAAVTAVIGLIAYVLYFICELIVLWLSRTREYYADEFSVRETGNPGALCSALVLVGYGLATKGKSETKNRHSVASPSTLGISDADSAKPMAVCCAGGDSYAVKDAIKNAMKWDMWNVWAKFYELGSTHPLISKRLLAISELAPEFGQEPYITFDLVKPESYADDFIGELALYCMPLALLTVGIVLFFVKGSDPVYLAGGFGLCMLGSLIKYIYMHPENKLGHRTVSELLGEVKVSGITAIGCEVDGEIIGRGNPGCIFNEDFVLRDETGIVMLDYNQPLWLINKIFALFKSEQYFGKITHVTGWYRRSPVPYFEVKTMETDGKLKRCFTYQWGFIWRALLLALSVLGLLGIMA